jgi:hypothetical protein
MNKSRQKKKVLEWNYFNDTEKPTWDDFAAIFENEELDEPEEDKKEK